MTHCQHSELMDFMDGRVNGVEARRISRHLDTCAECAAAFNDMTAIQAAMRALPAPEAGQAFWTRAFAAAAGAEPDAPSRSTDRPRWTTRRAITGMTASAGLIAVLCYSTIMPAQRVLIAPSRPAAIDRVDNADVSELVHAHMTDDENHPMADVDGDALLADEADAAAANSDSAGVPPHASAL